MSGWVIFFTGFFRLFDITTFHSMIIYFLLPESIFYLYYFHIDFILPASNTLINYNIYYYCYKFLFIILSGQCRISKFVPSPGFEPAPLWSESRRAATFATERAKRAKCTYVRMQKNTAEDPNNISSALFFFPFLSLTKRLRYS